jgi:outer membrane protein OmpA-like peptidoglycan-associated protein
MRISIATVLMSAMLASCAKPGGVSGVRPDARPQDVITIVENELLFFDSGSAQLTPTAISQLDSYAPLLRTRFDRIEIYGHADRAGSTADNLKLSRLRAEAVRDALIAHGVPKDHLIIHAQGEDDPLIPTTDSVTERQNRIVVIIPGYSSKSSPASSL